MHCEIVYKGVSTDVSAKRGLPKLGFGTVISAVVGAYVADIKPVPSAGVPEKLTVIGNSTIDAVRTLCSTYR